MKSENPARANGGSTLWLQGLVCGALITLATPLALLLAVLLAPAIVAGLLDSQPGRPIARALLLFGLSASVDPAHQLLAAGDLMSVSLGLLSQPRVLAMAWGAAAGAWVLIEVVPVILGLAFDARSRAASARLQTQRERLLENWPGLSSGD